jgi:putative PIN family toxin of toxin-antitoxin system
VTRAVLDPGVLVSALITPAGIPAELLLAARSGSFELIASPLLLKELESVLRREKFRRYVDLEVVAAYIDLLWREADLAPDPEMPGPIRCKDPDDDYLIALAHDQNAALISGDRHLLELADKIPVFSPAEFLAGWESLTS